MPREHLARAAFAALCASAFLLPGPAGAEDAYEIGGDLFLSDSSPVVEAGRDVFAVGFSTVLAGDVAEDSHAVGFSVEVDANTEGDVYATGGTVSVRGSIGSDLTAAGMTVRTHPSSTTTENARLTGGSVTIGGPVEGALLASGGDILLDAPISGDAYLSGARIRFGPKASVGGQLVYSTREPVEVPESVADPARVRFQKMELDDFMSGRRDGWDWPDRPHMEIGPGAIFGALAATIGSFLLVGAVFLAFAPALVSRLRKGIVARPGQTGLVGLVGLSMLFGSVPILAMTLIGIPLVPIAILAIVIAWFLGYVLGAYSLGMGVARGMGLGEDPPIGIRLLVLAGTALVAAVLNFIPILGWLVNLVIVILGVGAMTGALFNRLGPNTAAKGPA